MLPSGLWESGMTTHSDDLRSRVVAEVAGGASRRAAAARFRVSASSAIRWARRRAETGSVGPRPRGGRSRSPLEPHAAWLLALIAEAADLTLPEIAGRLSEARGLGTTEASLRRFFRRHRISLKKKPARRRAGPTGRGRGAAGLEGRAARTRPRAPGLRR
jgi:transposase